MSIISILIHLKAFELFFYWWNKTRAFLPLNEQQSFKTTKKKKEKMALKKHRKQSHIIWKRS